MGKNVVRLLSIEINNFKNTRHGVLELASLKNKYLSDEDFSQADMLGIYGQNGSGKTAVIETLLCLKTLMSGNSLPENIRDYILKGEEKLDCKFEFLLRTDLTDYDVYYEFTVSGGECATLEKEVISYKKRDKGSKSFGAKSNMIEYNFQNSDKRAFSPKTRFDKAIAANKDNAVDIMVARRMAEKEKKSFIFYHDTIKILSKVSQDYFDILLTLNNYAKTNLFVIKNELVHNDAISFAVPSEYDDNDDNDMVSMGEITILLNEPTVKPIEVYNNFKGMIERSNKVISMIIPDLSLEIKEYGMQLTQDGKDGMRFELMSVRGENRIPIKYESEGIKKIISILNILAAVFNDNSVCAALDEVDAGVYEYLLGEILSVIEDGGKGQLIFTSHNLRPLEMIDDDALLFTTTNPENRYIRLSKSKNNNMRDAYLRSISLGGQKEDIYNTTNSFEISHAFRKAGKLNVSDKSVKKDEQ